MCHFLQGEGLTASLQAYLSADRDAERIMPALSHPSAGVLRELHLTNGGCRTNILSIEAVRSCVQLEKLSLHGFSVDLSPLAGCGLQEISLEFCEVSDLSPLVTCAQLRKLSLSASAADVPNLHQLQGCAVQILGLRANVPLSLEGIQALGQLTDLSIYCCRGGSVEERCCCSMAPLSACALLKKVNMDGHRRVCTVEPLQACAQLEELNIGRSAGGLLGLRSLKVALPRLRLLGMYRGESVPWCTPA
jgi:hypothetical protein